VILGLRSLTLRRHGASTWGSDGAPTSSTSDSTISGSWQPLNGKEIALLPEGERASDRRKMYTQAEVRTVDQHGGAAADLVSPDGGTTWFKAMKVADYDSAAPIPHYRVELVRLREGEA
jgi:hypothetical protein